MATTPADIFQQMPGKFNPQGAPGWETTIQFDISGENGGSWVMTIRDGKCEVKPGKVDVPKATLSTDSATFVGVQTGTVNPMQAFMTGKIKASGNIGELMKMNNPAVFKRS
jgi:putative sterol carrier protein